MPKENNSKRISMFLNLNNKDEQNLLMWLDEVCKDNFSGYIKQALTDLMNGITTDTHSLKDEQIKVNIDYKKTQIELNKLRILYYNTFGTEPSNQANNAMKTNVSNQTDNRVSCYNEKMNRLECPQCGILVVIINKDLPTAKNEFADHYSKKHGIIPSYIFEELTELK